MLRFTRFSKIFIFDFFSNLSFYYRIASCLRSRNQLETTRVWRGVKGRKLEEARSNRGDRKQREGNSHIVIENEKVKREERTQKIRRNTSKEKKLFHAFSPEKIHMPLSYGGTSLCLVTQIFYLSFSPSQYYVSKPCIIVYIEFAWLSDHDRSNFWDNLHKTRVLFPLSLISAQNFSPIKVSWFTH